MRNLLSIIAPTLLVLSLFTGKAYGTPVRFASFGHAFSFSSNDNIIDKCIQYVNENGIPPSNIIALNYDIIATGGGYGTIRSTCSVTYVGTNSLYSGAPLSYRMYTKVLAVTGDSLVSSSCDTFMTSNNLTSSEVIDVKYIGVSIGGGYGAYRETCVVFYATDRNVTVTPTTSPVPKTSGASYLYSNLVPLLVVIFGASVMI